MLGVERREHVDAPEADDDARHGREHLDERPDRAADGRRGQLTGKRPIAIETGAARSTAPKDVTIVPTIRSRAPNLFVTGFQSLFHRKSAW